jgi:hypothetical protein
VIYTDSDHHRTSSMRTLSTNLFNIAGVMSSTWTVIKLSAATLLHAATFPRFGVSNSAPNGRLSRAMSRRARISLSIGDMVEGGRRDTTSEYRGGGVERCPSNDRTMLETRRGAGVCGTTDVILEGPENDGNSPIEEKWWSMLSSYIVSVTLPTGCRSRRKSIQG